MSTRTEACPKCVANGKDSRGDNLVVWPDTSGHCFSCGYHRFPKTYTIKEIKEYVPKSLLPFDFTREVPNHAWQWLLQWGLGIQYWKESVGYSPSQQRLIFRVGDTQLIDGRLQRCGTPLAFSLGRYLPKENDDTRSLQESQRQSVGNLPLQQQWGLPLQRAKTHVKWLSYGDCHRHAEIVQGCSEVDPAKPIVLVEDLLSGHKVASAGYTAVPLFGTKVHGPVMYYLLREQRPVALWLDKDQEGNVKREAIHLQGILNRPVSVVVTDKDPKALSIDEINESLNAKTSL